MILEGRREMKKINRLQKILYLLMAVLGIYIIWKGAVLLSDSAAVQTALDEGNVQRILEDHAMRTYAPGYTGVIEGKDSQNVMASWMEQVLPVYSYLAGGSSPEETETESETDVEPETGTESEADIELKTGTEPETDVKPETGTEVGTDIELKTGTESETEFESEIGTAPETDFKSETEAGIEDKQEQTEEDTWDAIAELDDFSYFVEQYFTVDEGTTADAELLNAQELLGEDLTIQQDSAVPQILIYHTHSQEAFADSAEGETEDTIVGMGSFLAQVLEDTYGYQVIHDTGVYDLVDGVLDRSVAYDYARTSVEEILSEYPTIEVIIDLHRDGVDGQKFVTTIDGKPTAMIMFFNGISRDSQDQPISYLENPYTAQNLAFSLQLELRARAQYPGFTRNIYLKAERYNLHLRPRSLLVEAGTQLNTVEEERNAMPVLAELIDQVLSGKEP
jgi:stage II sporulation protein P